MYLFRTLVFHVKIPCSFLHELFQIFICRYASQLCGIRDDWVDVFCLNENIFYRLLSLELDDHLFISVLTFSLFIFWETSLWKINVAFILLWVTSDSYHSWLNKIDIYYRKRVSVFFEKDSDPRPLSTRTTTAHSSRPTLTSLLIDLILLRDNSDSRIIPNSNLKL